VGRVVAVEDGIAVGDGVAVQVEPDKGVGVTFTVADVLRANTGGMATPMV
jgi:hypothetical protein